MTLTGKVAMQHVFNLSNNRSLAIDVTEHVADKLIEVHVSAGRYDTSDEDRTLVEGFWPTSAWPKKAK